MMSSIDFRQAQFFGSYPSYLLTDFEQQASVAFAGKSNSGKSSLINAICDNKKLARTSNTPGRTQQFIFFSLAEQHFLVDLPGYGYAKVSRKISKEWGREVENFLKFSTNLKGLVLISDCRRDISQQDELLLNYCRVYRIPVIVFLSKADKLSYSQSIKQLDSHTQHLQHFGSLTIHIGSALKKQALEQTTDWIKTQLLC